MWVWAVSYSSWETASGSFGLLFFSKKKYLLFSKWLEIPYRKLSFFFFPFFFLILYTPVVCVGKNKHSSIFIIFCLQLVCSVFCDGALVVVSLLCSLQPCHDQTSVSLCRSSPAGNMFPHKSNLPMKILWWNPVICNICYTCISWFCMYFALSYVGKVEISQVFKLKGRGCYWNIFILFTLLKGQNF